jgi:HEAT repeat protein
MSISVLLDEESRPEVLREMFLALGRIGSTEAVQVLVRAAEPGGRLFRRKSATVRLGAIEGLERAGGPAATAALRALLQDDDAEVRNAAQRAVAALI